MEEKKVLATRYKTGEYISLAVFLVLLCLMFVIPKEHLDRRILYLVIVGACTLLPLYLSLLSKDAITVEGNKMIIRYVFIKKTVELKNVKWVSKNQPKTRYHYRYYLSRSMEEQNDVGVLWVVVRSNGTEKRIRVSLIEQVTATEVAINAFLGK